MVKPEVHAVCGKWCLNLGCVSDRIDKTETYNGVSAYPLLESRLTVALQRGRTSYTVAWGKSDQLSLADLEARSVPVCTRTLLVADIRVNDLNAPLTVLNVRGACDCVNRISVRHPGKR